jgi:hypothetical protein
MSSDNQNNSKKAYITSDGRYIEEPNDEVEELKKPRQVSKKQESVIPKKKAEKTDFQKKRGREFEKLDAELDHETDMFDEDGNIIEEESELKQRLKELEEKIEQSLTRIIEILDQKFKQPLIKLKNKFLSPINRVVNVFKKVLNRRKQNEPNDEIIETPKEKKLSHGTFENMLELNVILTDNYDVPLYKKRNVALAKTEESLILMTAKDAIKQCAEFTKGMPAIQSGYYEGKEIIQVMGNVEDDDVTLFLGYIKARPQKYVAKSWKISETFATWLANNAPMSEE